MTEFLPTFIAALILAACSHYQSVYDQKNAVYIKKERLFYGILTVILILFVGLRTAYNDTFTYIGSYEKAVLADSLLESLAKVDWRLGNNPGYNVILILFRYMGVSTQSYLMFYAIITVGIYMWFIHKYTNHILLSIFLFITVGNYLFSMAAIKQCAAIAFCLLGVDRALEKRTGAFIFWTLLGALFHPYALLYLIVPFLYFCPWTSKTYILLAAFFLCGALLQPLMGTIINVTTMLGEGYNEAEFLGEGVNPFRLAVVAVPTLISFVTKGILARSKVDRTHYLLMNLTTINAAIMYVALFGTANYFARLANYFIIFQVITIPWLFTHFEKRSKAFLTAVSTVCYMAFFYYGNVLDQNLDSGYAAISLWQYLQSLI